MPQSSDSLDRLNDIVLPPEVPWWPLAPGWYVLLTLCLIAACWLAWGWWKTWQANRYRRIALQELAVTDDPTAIAELLRRTALVIAPREQIASLTGGRWVDWLASRLPTSIPPEVRVQLEQGVYQPADVTSNVDGLREYAAEWISGHDRSERES